MKKETAMESKRRNARLNGIQILLSMCFFLLITQAFALDVNVVDYGAVPNDANEDTVAVQAAVDAVYAAGGGTVGFPLGTYIVKIVKIKPAVSSEIAFTTLGPGAQAVIKLRDATTAELNDPTHPHKWNRMFTTDGVAYNGATNSNPLTFRKLTFDLNRQNQGPYVNYEVEHQAAIFLAAAANSPGKVVGIVEDCFFHDGAADAVSAHYNVSLQMRRNQATDVFRGGLCTTGGNTDVFVDDFTIGGDVHKTGIDIEVDGAGYGGSMAVNAVMQHMHIRGDFDIGLGGGSTFTASDITVDESPFLIYAKDSTVDISDSTFNIGSDDFGNHLYFAKDVTFRNCTFTAKKITGDNGTSFSTMHIIFMPTDSGGHDQKATFDNCNWTIASGIIPSDTTYAVRVVQDQASRNNQLNIVNCTIGTGYDYGVYLEQGGKVLLQNTDVDATTGIRLKREAGYDYDVTVDGVTFGVNNVTSENIYNSDLASTITHRNMVLAYSQNTLSTTSGLEQNIYNENRRIIGSTAPGSSTPGLKGDLYQIDPLPAPGAVYQWICTLSHQTAATWTARQYMPAADSSLIGNWRCDEESENLARDSAGNSHDGTLTNGPVRTLGRLWRSLNLDGYDDYVSVGGDENAFDFAPGQNFTFSAWIKWDGTSSQWQPVIQKGNLNSNNYYFLGVQYGGNIYFKLKDGANVYAWLSGGSVQANTWAHIAGVKDEQRIRIYVNGTEVSSAVHGFTSGFSSSFPLRLGFLSYLTPPSYFNVGFHGTIDEVYVYNRALGADEVRNLYSRMPMVTNDSGVTTENVQLVLNILDNDSDDEKLTVTGVSQPTYGTATINSNNTVTYAPSVNYTGSDSFTYTASDEYGRTATATASVMVYSPDADPTKIASWLLNETDGTTTVDASGNNHNGTLVNNPSWTGGHSGNGLLLDGYDDYMSVPGDENFFDFASGENFTFTAWIKWDGANQNWQPVLQKGNLNSNNYYFLGIQNTGNIYFKLKDGANVYAWVSAGSIPSNSWAHVAGVKDSMTMSIYVNGNLMAHKVHGFTSGFSSTQSLRLGFLSYLTPPTYVNYGFHGVIDEVCIYSRALSAGEILALFTE